MRRGRRDRPARQGVLHVPREARLPLALVGGDSIGDRGRREARQGSRRREGGVPRRLRGRRPLENRRRRIVPFARRQGRGLLFVVEAARFSHGGEAPRLQGGVAARRVEPHGFFRGVARQSAVEDSADFHRPPAGGPDARQGPRDGDMERPPGEAERRPTRSPRDPSPPRRCPESRACSPGGRTARGAARRIRPG